jgi:tetratricopeptide (TPR) repeat protein
MTTLRRCLPLVCCLLAAPSARAQSPDPTEVQARQEFALAKRELDLGHLESALAHFEASYRASGKVGLLYNIGYVYKQLYLRTQKLDQLEQAIERLQLYLAGTKAMTDPVSLQQRARAEKELREAEDERRRVLAAQAKGEAALALGERLLSEGNPDEARAELERFERTPGNERAGVARAFLLRAALAAAAGDVETATLEATRALSLDRALRLAADAPEALRAPFDDARSRLGQAPVLAAAHTPPGSVKPSQPVQLAFTLSSDPAHLAAGLRLFYRGRAGAFSSVTTKTVGTLPLPREFTAGLPPGSTIEYYAVVLDQNEAILEHLGTPSLPFAVAVEAAHAPPVWKRRWFWPVVVGAAALVAVGVGLGVGLSQPEPATPLKYFNGSLLTY